MSQEERKITIDISTATLLKIFGLILLLIFLYIIREVVAVLLISVILVAAISPLVRRLSKLKIPRSISVLGIYILIFGTVGFLGYLLVPAIASQIKEISHDVPHYMDRLSEIFGRLPNHQEIAGGIQESLKNFGQNLTDSPLETLSTAFKIFGGLVTFFVILVLVFYMSVAEESIKAFFKTVLPKSYEKKVEKITTNIQKKIGDWVKGELILIFAVGSLSFIGLKILGIKFALILAIIAGILEIVPIIGPTISAIPAIIVAFAQEPILALAVLILYVIIQQFENHILVPKVMEKTTGVSPVIVILALLIGAKLLGILGIILAVPISLIVLVFIDELLIKTEKS